MTRVQLIMDGSKATSNSVTDFLYALSPSQWKTLAETSQFAGFTDTLNSTAKEISHVQNFFGLNIADQPLTYIKAAFCRWICSSCYRCDSYPDSCVGYTDDQLKTDASGSTAERRFTAGCNDELHEDNEYGNAVDVSSILFHIPCRSWYLLGSKCCSKVCSRLLSIKKMDKIQIEDLISENMKKMEKKREKAGLPPQKITNQAHQSAKNINKIEKGSSNTNVETRAKKVEEAYKDAANAKPGSITAKANLVKAFDERNKKK